MPDRSTILGAVKLTGKSRNGLSVGLLNGLTAAEYALNSPVSNFLASRAKREFDGGNTTLGGMFTMVGRISSDSLMEKSLPGNAMSGGIDLLHYWKDRNYYFEVKSIATRLHRTREAIHLKQLENTHRFQRTDDFEYYFRNYNQQYVARVKTTGEDHFLVGWIGHQTASVTFRGEWFLNPELSVQYYGSPYYSVGSYDRFQRVQDASARDPLERLELLDVAHLEDQDRYLFNLDGSG